MPPRRLCSRCRRLYRYKIPWAQAYAPPRLAPPGVTEWWSDGAESVAPLLQSNTPSLQSASRFLHITDKRFSFVHRNIWIGYQRCQLVDDVSRGKAFIAPMPRHTDLVDDFSVNIEGTHPLGDQRFGANLRARTRYLA